MRCMRIVPTLIALMVGISGSVFAGERPNVLFILTDDQRCDTIASQGNPHIQTPALDRLAQEGVAFSQAYIMGSMQGAVCKPSRAMLMSGRPLFRVNENLKNQSTWPEQFRNSGYETFISGKWHNETNSLLRSFDNGKAIFLGGMGNPFQLAVSDISDKHQLVNHRTSNGEHSVKLFADSAVEFLSKRKTDRPFLCYVAFNAPHDPRVVPESFPIRYEAEKLPLPGNFLPQHPFNNGELTIRDERLAPWPRTPEIVKKHRADYYRYITFMDEQIARILDSLKKSGQYENTIIVFSSDNGLALGSHGLFGKQNLYDHSIHEPLIIAGPGIPRGKKCEALCYLFDIFPTLGDYCQVAAPQGNEGLSLKPHILGEATSLRTSVFSAYTKTQRAVRDERWKLIVYPQINKTQLFDLQNDPNEMKDLAGNPAFAEQLARMTTLLKEQQKQWGDTQALAVEKPQSQEFDFSKVKSAKKAAPVE